MAFATYFAMYAYRKPFAAATYKGAELWGLELKSWLVISQLAGYAASKMLGVKFNSELTPGKRAWALIGLIVWAEAALVAFAIVPPAGKPIALFINGLPLGTVWGIVFSFLEGRRTSEILGAGLSCAYVVASGAVRSIGTVLLHAGISEAWMPATTGALFLPIFLAAVYGLKLLPPPSPADVAARTEREPMSKAERRAFARDYLPGLVTLIVVYLFLTAYRDFRDNYSADIWADLGGDPGASVFTLTEIPIGVAVMAVLTLLYAVKDNRRGLFFTYLIMGGGSLLIGVSTLLFDAHILGPKTWIITVGFGVYFGYVPYGSVLFDRTIAALQTIATAVFLIYISDAFAYGGAVAVVLYKNLGQVGLSKLTYFRYLSYVTCAVCTLGFAASGRYFLRRARALDAD